MDESLPEIPPQEARERIASGALHIDVRERDEYAARHIPGATLLPLSEFMERYETELPDEGEIVVSCRSGARSGRVVAFLRERGYDAVNLGGGILDWEAEGFPVERPGASG
jgi:rhodanese-related sulfurtransferase